ncbi:uncharacterized protein PHACADRAFT_209731 [Phanerochaete carnosa HHB-10118-sp]|uniref:Uncharacterized protein n=1 Tax=Phanerochaete carnosa (strain HHB-10118-sp) TaxID=650164 RepID=K5WTY8_PHACS|nr:uncharacterized protein PHACADRAFT_209731 [Phanerochaete carnosa HHB-10118-sp]EKM53887.1 hypothetical protein PHACADRAFT_209731 [Phanerochaete carnosa HHB-10118-sp]
MPTYIFDDYFGDERPGVATAVPTFLPAVNQWDPIGGTCASCTLSTNLDTPINPTKAQNGTWHSVTVSPDEPETTITITFSGTAVTAYCILPPDLGPWITSYMNMSFILDDDTVGKFERTASGTDWTYNYPVFSTSNLENKQHTFVVQPRADVNTSYMVFDYFTYDFEDPSPTSAPSISPSSPEPASPQTSSTSSSSSELLASPPSGSPSTPSSDPSPNSSSTSSSDSAPNLSSTSPTVSSAPNSPSLSSVNSVLHPSSEFIPGHSASSSSTSFIGPTLGSNLSLSNHSSMPVGAIIGGVVGGVAFILFGLLALWYIWRRRARTRERLVAYEAKEAIYEVSYPATTPFLANEPATSSEASKQSASVSPAPRPSDHSASGSRWESTTLLSSSSQWPSSAEGKRALADASLQRMIEMERQVAQDEGRVDGEENGRLQREIEALQAQVHQLNMALEQQAEEIRQAALYDEAPPSYEAELERRSTAGRS